MGAPHRAADEILDGFATGATGFVNSAANTVKSTGESVMRGLDKPFTDLTGRQGPHRVVARLADGIVDAGVNFVNAGIVGSIKMAGDAFMSALDQPIEQLKIPAGLGKIPLFKK